LKPAVQRDFSTLLSSSWYSHEVVFISSAC
jgi:hypothetical protein